MIALLLAAALFAPPEDRTFRQVVERTIDGAVPRRFRLERRIRFARDAGGVIADITLERTAQAPAGAMTDAFARGQAPFVGVTLRAHFAPEGAVAAVDGAEAVFAAMIAALGGRAAAPLAALPPERRLAMLAGIAEGLAAGADAAAAPGTSRVALLSALPGGRTVPLAGTRIVTTEPDGALSVSVHAEGEGVVLDRVRLLDPATGLVREEREVRTVTVGGITETSRSTVTLTSKVS